MNRELTPERFDKAMEECEQHLDDAHKSLRKACNALGIHIPIPLPHRESKARNEARAKAVSDSSQATRRLNLTTRVTYGIMLA